MDFICALDKILWILKKNSRTTFCQMWVRIFNNNLKMSLLTILWHSYQLCWCCQSLLWRNENPWYSCLSQLHHGSFHCYWCAILTYFYHATNQIFLQDASSCCLKNFYYPKRKINFKTWAPNDFALIYDDYDKIFLSTCDRITKLYVLPNTKISWLTKLWVCVLILSAFAVHMTCCQMSSTCLQNFKIYVLLWIAQDLTNLKNVYRFYGADN